MNERAFIDKMVDKGFIKEDMSDAFLDMFSFYNKILTVEAKSLDHLRTNHYPPHGRGSMNPEVLIVSDIPTKTEMKTCLTGFDEYGVYIMMMLQKLNINMNDTYWTHAVKRDIPSDQLTMKVIKHEYRQLKDEISLLKPSVIIALGTISISSLANEPVKIEDAMGEDFSFELSGGGDIPVIPILHPTEFLHKDRAVVQKMTMKSWRSIKMMKDFMESW